MVDLTLIEAAFIAALPTISSVIAIITTVIKIRKDFEKLKDNEELKAERDALAEQNKALLAEVRKQNKLTKLYIEKVSKVVFKDLDEVKNDQDLQN